MRCGLSSKFVELVTVGVGLNAVIRFYNEARSGRNFVDEEFGYFSRSTERSYLGLRSVVPRRREKPTLPYRRQWRKLSVLRHQPGGPPFTPWSHRLPQGSLHMQNRRRLGPLTILYVIVILYWLLCCLRCDSTPCYKKTTFLIFVINFGKCRPIFKSFSPTDSDENCLCTSYTVFHLISTVLLHYLAKFKNLK